MKGVDVLCCFMRLTSPYLPLTNPWYRVLHDTGACKATGVTVLDWIEVCQEQSENRMAQSEYWVGYRLDDRRIGVQFQVGPENFRFLCNVPTWLHYVYSPLGYQGHFPE